MKHLNKQIITKTCERLHQTSSSLKGVGSLFLQCQSEAYLESDDLTGLGHFLNSASEELSTLEDILRCGEDSTHKQRYGFKSEND